MQKKCGKNNREEATTRGIAIRRVESGKQARMTSSSSQVASSTPFIDHKISKEVPSS